MRKKSKKCRKVSVCALGGTPSANKENSFSNIFCRKGAVQNFRTKPTELATRSCTINKKQNKKMKKEKLMQQKHVQDPDNTEFLSFTFKISSVSFFIPLNDYTRSYQEDGPSGRIIDWSNLLLYKCSSRAMLSYYPNEQVTKMYYYKPTILPELRLKCRTVSESSNNSEDSFICFENDDSSEEHHNYNSIQFNKRGEVGTSYEYGKSLYKEHLSSKKKKVRFVDNSELVTVHLIIAWDYAYRAARISQWEMMARDSQRFKQKIRSLEPILSPVLNPEHRAKIWESKMRNDKS